MRYRVYTGRECIGEFDSISFKIESDTKIRCFCFDSKYYVDIYYQEPIFCIRDDHDRLIYKEEMTHNNIS